MDPPIEDSITHTELNHWILGSLYTCEVVVDIPKDIVTSWEADGRTYCIRKSSAHKNRSTISDDLKSDRFHHAGTSAAVWHIGGIFIKVKAWRDGMQLESDTIDFINRISSVTTPKVLYSWVDVKWNRSFLVLKAMEGQTLDQAWDTLSADQREQIANTVARVCKTLSLSTSENLMSVNGSGIVEPFLSALAPSSEPSWKPQIFGPYSQSSLKSLFPGSAVFDSCPKFHLYHADLGPSNIMVREDGSFVGIIDWESAAFYPMFWLGTKPLVSAGFYLNGGNEKKLAWVSLLTSALEQEKLSPDLELYRAWIETVRR